MRDRQATKPGRMLLTPEDGSAPFYATVEMADEPTDLGTPPTKQNLLQDSTEVALFGDAADRTVDQAFLGIARKIDLITSGVCPLTLTVKDQSGNPVQGVCVEGTFTDDGDLAITNASGVLTGYIKEGSVTMKISGYADIVDATKALTAIAGSSYTETWTVTRRNFLKVTTTQMLRFSDNATTADVTSVGGGGNGTIAGNEGHVAAGGGGYCAVQSGIALTPRTSYQAIIGAGGNIGGTSSFLGVSAPGGRAPTALKTTSRGWYVTGGVGNGKGGDQSYNDFTTPLSNSPDGVAGSVDGYDSFTTTTKYGGGGAAEQRYRDDDNYLISNDGRAAGYGGAYGKNGKDGFGGGAGAGANGGSGCVTMRIHFDFGDLAA